MTASIVFVGESPPAGALPDFSPFDCASGTRLASILGLRDRATLLAHVPRDNLFATPTGIDGAPAWNFERSLAGAEDVRLRTRPRTVFVLLGRRVADAFFVPRPVPTSSVIKWAPMAGSTWTALYRRCIYIPHPSGANSTYTAEVKREVRQMLLPELILGAPSLRPWHFNISDPLVLQDLAVAMSPLCPALGAAAMVWADGQHKAQAARQSTPLLERINEALGPKLACVTIESAMHYGPQRIINDDVRDRVVLPPWDEPMRLTVDTLLRHDGGRILGAAWDPARVAIKAGRPGWLTAMSVQYSNLNNCSRHVARATMARYAEAGI